MKKKRIQFTLTFFLVTIISSNIQAQVFKGLTAFKELIEYEGQRYLMEEVYQIKSENYDKLKIEKTIKQTDGSEGFMFVLSSYIFNDKSGVVITSLNSTNFTDTRKQFVNVHLTNEEFQNLNSTFKQLNGNSINYDQHVLRRFNDRLIVDVNNEMGTRFFTLWVDYNNRHTFSIPKWEQALKKYDKFVR